MDCVPLIVQRQPRWRKVCLHVRIHTASSNEDYEIEIDRYSGIITGAMLGDTESHAIDSEEKEKAE